MINAKIDALVITYVDTERYITTWTDRQREWWSTFGMNRSTPPLSPRLTLSMFQHIKNFASERCTCTRADKIYSSNKNIVVGRPLSLSFTDTLLINFTVGSRSSYLIQWKKSLKVWPHTSAKSETSESVSIILGPVCRRCYGDIFNWWASFPFFFCFVSFCLYGSWRGVKQKLANCFSPFPVFPSLCLFHFLMHPILILSSPPPLHYPQEEKHTALLVISSCCG